MPAESRPTRHVVISLGGMGGLNDGLGEFALQMGEHVARHAPRWREQHAVHFAFHLREHLMGRFGPEVGYIAATRLQQWLPVRAPCDLWHSLHQMNRHLPPSGTPARLLTVHDLNYVYKDKAFSRWRDHRRALALLARTDHIVAISQYSADDVRRHWHWSGPLEVIVRGPRELIDIAPDPLPGLGKDGRPFLFHLSRFAPSKNPQAMLGLAAAWPEVDFLFCGPANEHLKELAATNTQPNVIVQMAISDAQKSWAYAHCTGFLFPSFSEGFGLPPIEAMQFGKPVFLSRLTSLPEVGGDAAYYFDDFAPASMRAVVEDGLRRGAEPARIEYVKAHARSFSREAAADAYMALYARLLGLPRA